MAWVEIKGYKWPYRINEDAVVQKLYKGEWVTMKTHTRGRTRAKVKMRSADGREMQVPVVHLMADAFFGGRKPGVCFIHRNGVKADCSLANLKKATKSECGKLSGMIRRRAVAKIDRDGNVVAIYATAVEAGKRNYMSKDSVLARCRREIKDPYRLDGHNYLYEDDMNLPDWKVRKKKC